MRYLFIILSVLILVSCGKSEEELLMEEQRIKDSIDNYYLEKKRVEDSIEGYQRSPAGIAEKEIKNGKEYITFKTEWVDPLFGNDFINLKIKNNAKYAVYKELVFELKFISRTESVVKKKDYTLYDYILPGENYSTTIKCGNAPNGGNKYILNLTNYKTSSKKEAEKNKMRKYREFS